MININLEDTNENMEVLYEELQAKYVALEEKYASLLKEYEALKQNKSKAGRRPNDEKWTAKLQAFAAMKDEGASREEIQDKLNMSRATYFRFNKIYSEGGVSLYTKDKGTGLETAEKSDAVLSSVSVSVNDSVHAVEEVLVKAENARKEHSEGLVLDPDTGDYVTPEGLKRRRKLAEIRARRAAEEEKMRLAEAESDHQNT